MELGIKACEIMRKDFLILDSTLTLETCIKNLNKKQEACIVLENGFFHSILSCDDLLKIFFLRKSRNITLKEIKASKNFIIVSPETDIFDIIKLMKEKAADFILVRDKNFLGLITKKEIVEINQLLFDIVLEKERTTVT